MEKVEGRLPVRQAGKKAKSAAKAKLSAAFGAGSRKRPAGRNTHPCGGRDADWPCIYNLQRPGTCGSFDHHSPNHGRKCVFCNDKAIHRLCGSAAGRSHILSNMKKFRAAYEEKPHVYNSALLRIPDKHREEIHKKAAAQALPRAAARRERARRPRPAPAQTAKTSWATALASRKRAWRPLTAAEARSRLIASGPRRSSLRTTTWRRRQRRTSHTTTQGCRRPPSQSRGASWSSGRLEPIDCRRVAKPEIAPRACKACQNGKILVPKFEDIPEPLRNLSKEVVRALRPLDIDVGPYRRAAFGYRAHGAMIRLAWAVARILSSNLARFGSCR